MVSKQKLSHLKLTYINLFVIGIKSQERRRRKFFAKSLKTKKGILKNHHIYIYLVRVVKLGQHNAMETLT
jgi:hypothetical protein